MADTHHALPEPSTAATAGSRLTGNLGPIDLAITVLAASAPLSVMAAFAPVSLLVGNGLGMVQSYLIAGVALAMFAFGFLAMGRAVSRQGGDAGALYTYIVRGLGKPIGLGGAFLAVFSYALIQAGTFGMLGESMRQFAVQKLGVSGGAWWQYALLLWCVVAALGYRRLNLSARVLEVAMIGEILVVTVLDLAILLKGSPQGYFTLEPFTPAALLSGSPGLGVMFAVAAFIGFEATAIYSEEVRDPRRTIPRATFASIAVIALLYSFSTWCLINAFGPAEAVRQAHADPTAMFPKALMVYVSAWSVDVMYVLLISSLFAAVLSFHNALARYYFSFGIDGVLPGLFARIHSRHGSPANASMLQSAVALLIVAPFAILHRDAVLELYAWGIGVGTMAMLLVFALASIATLIYLKRHGHGIPTWDRSVAPVVGFVMLGLIAAYATFNFDSLVEASRALTLFFLGLIYASFLMGVVLAVRWRHSRPDCYARIGRSS
ncbi:MAG: APC family permease [Dehalococcoidia bacterium]